MVNQEIINPIEFQSSLIHISNQGNEHDRKTLRIWDGSELWVETFGALKKN